MVERVRVPAIDAAREPRIQRAFFLIYDGRAKHAWWRQNPVRISRLKLAARRKWPRPALALPFAVAAARRHPALLPRLDLACNTAPP